MFKYLLKNYSLQKLFFLIPSIYRSIDILGGLYIVMYRDGNHVTGRVISVNVEREREITEAGERKDAQTAKTVKHDMNLKKMNLGMTLDRDELKNKTLRRLHMKCDKA